MSDAEIQHNPLGLGKAAETLKPAGTMSKEAQALQAALGHVFSEVFKLSGDEAIDLTALLAQRGYIIVFDDSARVS